MDELEEADGAHGLVAVLLQLFDAPEELVLGNHVAKPLGVGVLDFEERGEHLVEDAGVALVVLVEVGDEVEDEAQLGAVLGERLDELVDGGLLAGLQLVTEDQLVEQLEVVSVLPKMVQVLNGVLVVPLRHVLEPELLHAVLVDVHVQRVLNLLVLPVQLQQLQEHQLQGLQHVLHHQWLHRRHWLLLSLVVRVDQENRGDLCILALVRIRLPNGQPLLLQQHVLLVLDHYKSNSHSSTLLHRHLPRQGLPASIRDARGVDLLP